MKLGLFYPFGDFGNVPQDQSFSEVLEEIECGEELGSTQLGSPSSDS